MNSTSPLRVIGILELLTLLVLLVNLATVHRPDVSSVIGPVHGLCYTAAIIAAALLAEGRHRVWLLALIPGFGALLASRAAARRTHARRHKRPAASDR